MDSREREYLQTAEEAARTAGGVLAEWAGKRTVSEKSPFNLVTEADLASQQAIHRHISRRFPDHGFLGEEGLSSTEGGSRYRWIIDPLDGTTNYVHGFPYYGVSIALEAGGALTVGVVFDPNRDEMFAAVRGGGATLNGRPIRPSRIEEIGQALLVASLPVDAGREHPAVEHFLRALPAAQAVQRTGSAALNLAYVACGRIDAFWSISLNAWDMAAGVLIVTESGGSVTKTDGSRFDLGTADVLAANGPSLQRQISRVLVDKNV